MMKKAFVFVFLALAVLAAARTQDPITLKRVAKVGEKLRYSLKVEAETPSFGAIQFNATVLEEITSVLDDGRYKVLSKQQEAVAVAAGNEFPVPDSETTTEYTAAGLITKIESAEVSGDSYRLANLSVVLWPSNPVKVGDKWSGTIAASVETGAVEALGEYEVLEIAGAGGKLAVKINCTLKEQSGDDPASSESTVWIDSATGALIKAEGSWSNAPIMGDLLKATYSISMID